MSSQTPTPSTSTSTSSTPSTHSTRTHRATASQNALIPLLLPTLHTTHTSTSNTTTTTSLITDAAEYDFPPSFPPTPTTRFIPPRLPLPILPATPPLHPPRLELASTLLTYISLSKSALSDTEREGVRTPVLETVVEGGAERVADAVIARVRGAGLSGRVGKEGWVGPGLGPGPGSAPSSGGKKEGGKGGKEKQGFNVKEGVKKVW
ncbi:hypothetical protein M501DRAFT_991538 [Patellaria atrata CBS 101060]|uniref:Uncharacterized protein n=1 Tax=Patellaria atrata CBS 101060 TaxID=1346257 RepID=A0A9P4SBF1_9PEZI|nr:hypothetical protein M501DRAFT_991538 [Patellaria atrata CBS 101060]